MQVTFSFVFILFARRVVKGLVENDFDLARLLKASIVIGATHVFGESFHINGLFAKQTGFASTALLFGFGNTKDLCAQLLRSLSKILAKSVGVLLVPFDKLEFIIYNIYLYHRIRQLFSLHESFL